MLGRFYVGHEIFLRKRFIKFKYASNSISCHFSNYYFVSRKCVLLQRDNDGSYMYFSNRNKCNVIDPNNLIVTSNSLGCHQCEKYIKNTCDLKENAPDVLLGVLDIQPIESFTNTNNLSLAISLINEYNCNIDSDNEKVYVDDIQYIDTIREIDFGSGFKKIYKKESE